MALSWNEIKDRALKFSKEWADESSEKAEKDTFWNEFFNVFGIKRRRVAIFEEHVKKLCDKDGYIDLFWPGILLVEHKSRGKDLDSAFGQAADYFAGILETELPKYIIVSDFDRIRLYDLEERTQNEFYLKDFHDNVNLFGFIAGYKKRVFKEQDPVNIKAADLMGKLHDQLEESGYTGHSLEIYLVRLLFCLFADDSGIFEKDTFKEFIEIKTNEDGSDLGAWLAQFFQVLDKPREERQKNLDEHLGQFPYVNGKLFEEQLPIAAFNSQLREILLECSALDWGMISPAIFGSMFQSVMDPEERRNLGAHYTSEKNILKLIKPLFLDDLYAEFEKTKGNKNKLQEFHKRLSTLKFLDPACGCGNFLVITYRELRLIELEILRVLYKGEHTTGVEQICWIDVDQFYGIEYEEWPARIAEVALWLMDHQMNMLISEEFGQYFVRLPLKKAAKIVHGNALRIDWEAVISKSGLNYILGNPPFIGAKYQNLEQKQDIQLVFQGVQNAGLLDYVTAWYLKAAKFIEDTTIKTAFVSTNSISQGEQVSVLWNELLNKYEIKIHFAHRTFQWMSESKRKAAVFCIIIGFSNCDGKQKVLYEYESIKGEAHERKVTKINPYLIDGPDVLLSNRSKPLCEAPEIGIGNKPIDDGNYLFLEEEMQEFLSLEPKAKKFFHPWMGATEFLYGKKRWVLWLGEADPSELRAMPKVLEKIEAVRKYRLKSKSKPTQRLADTPTRFHVENMPCTNYLLIPEVTSERRKYIPTGFISPEIISSNLVKISGSATVYHFGILASAMHMAWTKYVCGRLKGDFRYSIKIVYNNFPWPNVAAEKNIEKVKHCAEKVLEVRDKFKDSSLADLYDPLTMPPNLVKAHRELDKAVDLCYRPQSFTNETRRIEFLFDLYNQYTTSMFSQKIAEGV